IASDYCYKNELQQAMAQHEAGKAQVIPIILRPTDWGGSLFVSCKPFPPTANPLPPGLTAMKPGSM
ncbi:MAG: hypothetical protein AAFX51_03630, partial [Cyanobacteria bacterium J06636_28]